MDASHTKRNVISRMVEELRRGRKLKLSDWSNHGLDLDDIGDCIYQAAMAERKTADDNQSAAMGYAIYMEERVSLMRSTMRCRDECLHIRIPRSG